MVITDDAFRELTEVHRRELLVHCYRMLGSLQDAEDVLQETLLAAWQGLPAFEGRASVRTWLYRIATNRCLNALRSASRRPATAWSVPGVEPPEPTQLGEVTWLEPYPDEFLPEARVEQVEAMSLAFITALQLLPERQRAALILRDVLGYRASEAAAMLDTTVESVNSLLKRARATLPRRPEGERAPAPTPGSPEERALVAKIVRAYDSGHVDQLVELLTADATMTMPPLPLEYHGRDAVAAFLASISRPGRQFDVVPTRANGHLTFGLYLRSPGGRRHANGLDVISLAGTQIDAITHFDNSVLAAFGLPHR